MTVSNDRAGKIASLRCHGALYSGDAGVVPTMRERTTEVGGVGVPFLLATRTIGVVRSSVRLGTRTIGVVRSSALLAGTAVELFLVIGFVFGTGSASAEVYPKIEASFNITGLATDPFDYTVTDVRVQIAQPNGVTNSFLAFFDGGTTWRVRHTPALAGIYQVAGVSLNGQSVAVSNLQPASWNVTGTPTSPGYVRVDPANTNRFITSNGRRHFPLGNDVAWWTNNTQIPGVFSRMGGAHENWSRVWMTHFYDSLNLEWPKVGNFGTYSLPVAQKWDAIINAAEQSGIFFQVTLHHHGQYASTIGSNVNPNWEQNPYNSALGGFLTNASQFFTDAQAKALTKRKLRYIVARWGYSPAIMGWELFNEVQFTDAAYANQWTNIAAWHDAMAQFIRSQDMYQHLVTTSSQLDQQIWNQCDYYQHHDYPSDLISGLQDPAGVPAGQPVKPIFSGECGSNGVPYLGFHAPIWAGLMGAQSGAAQQWYGDGLEADNAYGLFRAGRDFVRYAGLAEQDTLAKSASHVACPVNGSLSFAPGGGFATNTGPDTFTVGDAAPDGIGTLPSYLQGDYHRGMTPNGYTFLVNYPTSGGTFAVQVLIIARSGAGLTIYLDGAVANSISWPTNSSDVSTNFTLSVTVPAGQHTVKLYNPGLDWVDLGNLTLNPYASMLGGYHIGNSNFAALWLWHRTNIYYPGATATLSGTVPISGLQPGNYGAVWWDTFAGGPLSNFTFTVADTNPVTVPTPPILRSVALYAGLPAHAAVNAPSLTRALGSNSPPLILPLVITNSGGLPLAYSLSVTGANPVIYAATSSTQPGGPVFAWRDISVIGRDLTTNFTALTGKSAKDEGIAGPIGIGFSFPFFSGAQSPEIFTQLYVSPNGYVTFSPFAGDTSLNQTLPNALAPSNCLAFFWDDLDLSTAGRIYCATDSIAGTFTLQYQKAPIKGTSTNVTCQLILKTTGEILVQYQTVGISNTCTVGVQNAARSQGLQVAYNQNYVQSGMAVQLSPTPWLGLAGNAGLVPKSSSDALNLSFNPAGLSYGTYTATLLVRTADPALPLTVLPVALSVLSPIDLWRLANFGTSSNSGNAADSADPDHDGLINIFEYAFDTNPNVPNPSPLALAVVGNHLTIIFKRTHPAPPDISYLFDVNNDLVSGAWQSGPAFTTLTASDNHDGTETVTVTDNTAVGASAAHYLRVRISRP